jgi:hypothetical protein
MNVALRFVVIVLACLPFAMAQEAKIIVLDTQDTTALSKAYKEYTDARLKWEKTKDEVIKRYTVKNGKKLNGWYGMTFSDDFKAAIPDSGVGTGTLIGGPCTSDSCTSDSSVCYGSSSHLVIDPTFTWDKVIIGTAAAAGGPHK